MTHSSNTNDLCKNCDKNEVDSIDLFVCIYSVSIPGDFLITYANGIDILQKN